MATYIFRPYVFVSEDGTVSVDIEDTCIGSSENGDTFDLIEAPVPAAVEATLRAWVDGREVEDGERCPHGYWDFALLCPSCETEDYHAALQEGA